MEAENRFHQETAEVIRRFIDNSGHFDGKEEAEYGEPFYGHEMRNHILDHFTLYDEVAVNYIDSRKEEKTEGIILRIFFSGIVVGTGSKERNHLERKKYFYSLRRNTFHKPQKNGEQNCIC